MKIRATVWNEFKHEQKDEKIKAIYPNGIHGAIIQALTEAGIDARAATLQEPEHGLTESALSETDVLLWWGHTAHNEVSDEAVERVVKRVHEGMGFIALHSAHASKPFRSLMGTRTQNLRWREDDEMERLWVVKTGHPITEGIGDYFDIPHEETYGERFEIPEPDELVFVSWFPGGEIFRSGLCYTRGAGRVFYFKPGHETYPIYYQPEIKRVLVNAVKWAKPYNSVFTYTTGHVKPLNG